SVQQELAGTHRVVVVAVAELVLGDVSLHQPGFTIVVDLHPGLGERALAAPEGLDLRALQDDARLVAVVEEVVERGTPVLGRDLDAAALLVAALLAWFRHSHRAYPPGGTARHG